MAVTVVLKLRKITSMEPMVDVSDHEDDQYWERTDGKLEVHRADGTVKTYAEDSWSTVDGKRMLPGIA
jgi:hypothetical protein